MHTQQNTKAAYQVQFGTQTLMCFIPGGETSTYAGRVHCHQAPDGECINTLAYEHHGKTNFVSAGKATDLFLFYQFL